MNEIAIIFLIIYAVIFSAALIVIMLGIQKTLSTILKERRQDYWDLSDLENGDIIDLDSYR